MLSRRGFIGGAGASAAALALYGCSSGSSRSSGSSGSLTTSTTVPRGAGLRPDPSRPEGDETIPQIQHLIVLMMENHSYDNYFGMLRRGDGFTKGSDGQPTNANADANGKVFTAFHMPNTCQLPKQPSQEWNASHAQFNGGAMDGFVRSDSGPVAMGYFTGEDIPFYYSLAETFPVCDRWFGSCLAQTFPNRRFLLAGTSQGTIDNDITFVTSGPQPAGGTIMELLNKHGITWRDYHSSLPSTALFLPVFNANQDKVVSIDQYFADAAAGSLPFFSLVEPDFDRNSEENSDDITLGEAFAAKVINAAMHGPAWDKTMLVWCYDEHGGYYDHVAPPAAVAPDAIAARLTPGKVPGDFAQLGIRVPAAVVSPFSKADYVSSVVHDHTSILKFVETKFNLPALTNRDANADDLLDCLDFTTAPAFLSPPTLATPRNPDGTTPLCTEAGPIPS